ncbi:MAG TPA: hypothetical protein VGN57_13770 [Pirellulaceae bacterium]|jgi:hypothetical protein|nr:hypothetical protein [Pirellulaceae bacterium]
MESFAVNDFDEPGQRSSGRVGLSRKPRAWVTVCVSLLSLAGAWAAAIALWVLFEIATGIELVPSSLDR